ncbi:unnamed protein product [Pleuronectes platessa]|uniref:Uncharacterized protein n=1 Tax=Pleuronectes platessa TaxID=8262 RepID=A0A9N7W1D7_PLEPL|nr:unnamed protein product [Pleuronectes platessa]
MREFAPKKKKSKEQSDGVKEEARGEEASGEEAQRSRGEVAASCDLRLGHEGRNGEAASCVLPLKDLSPFISAGLAQAILSLFLSNHNARLPGTMLHRTLFVASDLHYNRILMEQVKIGPVRANRGSGYTVGGRRQEERDRL